ncbi:MAG: hypothetical protein HYS44_01335 [Candidatus Niyogibacteria bacterium]|nr:hypothetical protein [Candidatus Niyogibacteria bacterium]
MLWRRKSNLTHRGIEPDEIFLDSKNLPGFDRELFEGRLERPLSARVAYLFYAAFLGVTAVFVFRLGELQIARGEELRARADTNRLVRVRLSAERGLVYDRRGMELAWNDPGARVYSKLAGLAHVVGYVGYPNEFSDGEDPRVRIGQAGIERAYNNVLRGRDGSRLVEEDVGGAVISEAVEYAPKDGDDVVLTIDAELQSAVFEKVKATVLERGFRAGSAILTNPVTGEILAATSFPEYNSSALSASSSQEAVDDYRTDPRKPFFFRAFEGLYPPGSTFKTVVAAGALAERTITPEYQIFSSGSIAIPNPYNPKEESRFFDWKAHGWVDMRRALAVSSNVYFYSIGGGFENIKGLGVAKIADYAKKFGLGALVGVELPEKEGLVPTPEWKAKNQPSDPVWRVGDTYNLSIGQGMIQVTPLQMAQLVSLIAMDGVAAEPHLIKETRAENSFEARPTAIAYKIAGIPKDAFSVVKEGMHAAVAGGTASALSGLGVGVAGKTGTAEIGFGKTVNSWFIGFLPYENPQLALVVVLEGGDAKNLVGAPFVAREIVSWLIENRPEYLGAFQ